MSATLTTPAPLRGDLARAPSRGEHRPTLEQTLERAWRDAREGEAAECPLCHARMTLRAGEAECSGCGSRLS
jgi:hypothetical protein